MRQTDRSKRSRSRVRTAVSLLATATVLAGASAAGGQAAEDELVVESARQVTTSPDPARLFVSPVMAVHPDDPSVVVMGVADARNGGCGLRVSRDGGLSWATTATTVMPDDQPFCIQRTHGPAMDLAFASDGTLYMAVSGSSVSTTPPHPNGPITPLVARTEDLGATVETFAITDAVTQDYTLRDGSVERGVEQHKFNSVAVDPTDPDVVYRSWRVMVRGVDQPPVPGYALGNPDNGVALKGMVAVSTDGGRTWSDPLDLTTVMPEGTFGTDVPILLTTPDGTVRAFTREEVDRSLEDGGPPRHFMATSTDQGRTWTAQVVNENPDGVRINDIHAVHDPDSGNIYATFEQGSGRAEPRTVMFMSSGDGGQSWSTPVDVTDEDSAREVNQYQPNISVAPNGRIDIAWHDFRGDPFAGGDVEPRYSDVYMTYSTDQGASWEPNFRVNDRLIDRAVGVTFANQDVRGPIPLVATDDASLVAWPDSRASTAGADVEDVYFTRVRFETPALVATDSTSSTGPFLLGAAVALGIAGVALFLGTRVFGSSASRTSPAG